MQKYAYFSRLWRTAAVLCCVGSLFLAAACGGREEPRSGAASAAPLSGPADTVALYRSNCISCHGTGLAGNMGADSDLRAVGSRLTEAQIAAQIANGGGLMPAMKDRLTAEEIGKLAAWLAAKQ